MKFSQKLKKVIKGTGGYVNLWTLNQKISGLTFINPNILWDDMKDKFILYYENFFLKTFFVK